jgi:hypothetical protein
VIYGVWTLSLAVAYVTVIAFLQGVDSGGFDPQGTPLYRLVSDVLAGAFGYSLVDRLFAEGPFVFAHTVCFGFVVAYLAFSSVLRFAVERQSGAVHLVAYGPADPTSCALGGLIKDLFFTVLSSVVLLICYAILAGAHNLVLGPRAMRSLVSLCCLALGVYGVGVLAVALTGRAAAAIGVFTVGVAFFAALLLGSYAATAGYIRTLSTVISSIVRWFSPLSYWDLAMRSGDSGRMGVFWFSNAAQLVVCSAYVLTAHLLLRPGRSRS